jgi:hypothetical protein
MTSDLGWHQAANAAQVKQRIELGDLPQFPRSLDHTAYFPKSSADAAQEDLRAAGYSVDRVKRGFRRTLVEFSRRDAADLATADAFTREIFTIASRHGGAYDGWGGFLVTQPPSASQEG